MHFDPMPASQLNHKCAMPIDIVARLPRWRPNHFDSNHRPSGRSRPTMHALTIFIQRPDSQASLPAKRFPHQSTRFKLRNQSLGLGPATPPPHHSHFAHNSSAPLNTAVQQGALLRRIRLVSVLLAVLRKSDPMASRLFRCINGSPSKQTRRRPDDTRCTLIANKGGTFPSKDPIERIGRFIPRLYGTESALFMPI